MQGDVTRPDDARRMVDETLKKFGRLDILVNNAGVRPEGPFENLSLDSWHQVLAVILDGPFLCSQAALPALEKSGRGTIINIGGLTAYTGAPHRAHVITAKAGLDGFTKALAVELSPKKITVNLVAPGLIETKRDGADPAHRKSRTLLLTASGPARRNRCDGAVFGRPESARHDGTNRPHQRRRLLALAGKGRFGL
jgi:3-oxoacyl-[acyl-carrier protein] reductase